MTAATPPFASRPLRLPTAARILLSMLSSLEWGRLRLRGPHGFSASFGDKGPLVELALHDWSVCAEVIAGGDIAFGEAYMQGRWDSPDLVALMGVITRNQRSLEVAFNGSTWRRIVMNVMHRLRANTRRGARRNIEAHYDLGNDFYALWLDPTMTYSSALFDERSDAQARIAAHSSPVTNAARAHARVEAGSSDLEAGQWSKYNRVLRELALEPGQRVLEIGCGWGGFAEQLLRANDVSLTGLSLSPSQVAYAQDRLANAGLADRASIELRDYRDVGREAFDAVVSIEMIEAVGERWWQEYFATIARVLRPGGRAVLQAITIADDRFEQYRASSDFIQRYIFPGGMLPTIGRIRDEAARAGLAVESELRFGPDYATTLEHWLARFDAAEAEVRRLVFETRFIRMWRFYLAYCAGGFTAGMTDVGQYTLVRA